MDGRRDLTLLLPIDLIITLKSQQLFRLMSEDFVGGVYAHIYNIENILKSIELYIRKLTQSNVSLVFQNIEI